MTELFADTSYWMALVNPRDNLHAKARSVSREFASARVITSEMVLTELLNGLSDGGPWLRGGATQAVQALRGSQGIKIIPQTTEQCQIHVGTAELTGYARFGPNRVF